MRARGNRNSGFTLLEALLAFAILAVVVTSLYSAFFVSTRAMESASSGLVGLHELRSITDMMAREAESAYYIYGEDYTGFIVEDMDYYGKPASRFTLTAFAPQMPGLAWIRYSVAEKDGRLGLVKEFGPAYAVYSGTEKPYPFEMIEAIDSFSVEVLGEDDEWVRTFDFKTSRKPPKELRFTIALPDGTVYVEHAHPRIGRKL